MSHDVSVQCESLTRLPRSGQENIEGDGDLYLPSEFGKSLGAVHIYKGINMECFQ